MKEQQATSPEEAALVARLKAKDQSAFEELVEAYGDMLYRYVDRMCGSLEQAEDVLQDTLITAFEKIGQFRGEGKLRNWLFRVAANKCLQTYREHEAFPRADLDEDKVDVEANPASYLSQQSRLMNPLENLLTEELNQALEQAIRSVPQTNRAVLIMRDLEGLSTKETAEVLGISEEAVKVRLHRARLHVRDSLRKYLEEKS